MNVKFLINYIFNFPVTSTTLMVETMSTTLEEEGGEVVLGVEVVMNVEVVLGGDVVLGSAVVLGVVVVLGSEVEMGREVEVGSGVEVDKELPVGPRCWVLLLDCPEPLVLFLED